MSSQIHITMTADEAQAWNAIQKLVQKFGDMENKGRKTISVMERLKQAVKSQASAAMSSLAGMASSWLSIHKAIELANRAQQAHWEERNKRANATQTFEDAFTSLLSLGDNYKRPEALRKQVWDMAMRKAVDPVEVSRGWYSLQSNAADLSPTKQRDLMEGVTTMKRLLKEVPAEDLGIASGKIANMYKGLTGQEATNIAFYALDRAGVKNAQELATVIPKGMAAGRIGDVDSRTAAATLSYLTRKSGTAAQAGGAMDILYRKLMLNAPDEGETLRQIREGVASPFDKKAKKLKGRMNLMKAAGVTEGDNAHERVLKLAEYNKTHPLKAQDLKDLFGERGMKYGKMMFIDTDELKREVALFHKNTPGGIDLPGMKLNKILEDSKQGAVEENRRAKIQTQYAQQNEEAVQSQTYEDQRETVMEKGKYTGIQKTFSRWIDDTFRWIGGEDSGIFREDIQKQGLEGSSLIEAGDKLNEAADRINEAGKNLNRITNNIPNPNAHLETAP